jgi:hypothetical protein
MDGITTIIKSRTRYGRAVGFDWAILAGGREYASLFSAPAFPTPDEAISDMLYFLQQIIHGQHRDDRRGTGEHEPGGK